MRDIVDFFRIKEIIFVKMTKIDVKELGSRKKIEVYEAVDFKKDVWAIFVINQNSRFISKNSTELEKLYEDLKQYRKREYRKKLCLISSPICSKAQKYLQESKWKVEHGFM